MTNIAIISYTVPGQFVFIFKITHDFNFLLFRPWHQLKKKKRKRKKKKCLFKLKTFDNTMSTFIS